MGLVLIIEDEKPLRDILRLTLEGIGHTVIEAAQGPSGLALFHRHSPDLVITDVIMPEQSGIEVVAVLRSVNPDLPIIAMSGGGRARVLDLLDIAHKVGATVILSKPFRKRELVDAVDGLIGRPSRATLP
jgi:CheY-like chemotaxis protein